MQPFISTYRSVVATTLVAFATSAPERTVFTVAALAGQTEIGLGDALGRNVFSITLIFGLALLYPSVQASRQDFSRDFYLALAVPVRTFLVMVDGRIECPEALVLLAVFLTAGLDRAQRPAPASSGGRS